MFSTSGVYRGMFGITYLLLSDFDFGVWDTYTRDDDALRVCQGIPSIFD